MLSTKRCFILICSFQLRELFSSELSYDNFSHLTHTLNQTMIQSTLIQYRSISPSSLDLNRT